MPGDINTYALGIEFNLSATKAMDTLKSLSAQAEKIEQSFGQAFEMNIESDNITSSNEKTKQLTGSTQELNAIYRDINRTLTEYQDDLSAAGNDLNKQAEVHKEFNKELGLAERAYKDLIKEFGKGAPEVKKLEVDIDKLKDSFKGHTESLKENNKQWNEWAKSSRDSIDRMGKSGEGIISLLGDLGPVSSGTINKLLELGDAFGLLGEGANPIRAAVPSIRDAMKGSIGDMAKTGKAANAMAPALSALGGEAGGVAAGVSAAGGEMGAVAGMASKANPYLLAATVAYEGIKAGAGAAAGALEKMGMGATKAGAAVIEGIKSLNVFKMVLSFVTAAIEELIDAEEALRTTTFRSMGTLDQSTAIVDDLQRNLKLTTDEAIATTVAMGNVGLGAIASGKRLRDLGEGIAQFSVATGVSQEQTAEYVMALTAAGESVQSVTASLSDFTVNMRRAGLSSGEVSNILSDASKKAPDLRALFGAKQVKQYTEALGGLSAAFKKMVGPAGAGAAQSVMTKLADPFSRLSKVTGLLGDSQDDMYKRLGKVGEKVAQLGSEWDRSSHARKIALARTVDLSVGEFNLIRELEKEHGTMEKAIEALKIKGKEEEKAKKLTEKFAESTKTLKQEMMRLFVDIMQDLREAFKEIKPALMDAAKALKPFIKDVMSAVPSIISGFGKFVSVLGTIIKIGRVIWAVFEGFLEGVWFALEPLVDLWGTFIEVLGDVFGVFSDGSGESSSSLETLIDIAKWFGRIMGGLAHIVILPFTLLMRGIKWVSEKIGDLKRLMFGSSFLHIKEGIDFIMKPLTWLKDAFVWVWEKVSSLAGTVSGFLGDTIPKGVSIAKKAVNLLLAPFKAVGSAIGWVKKKLFGSSMLHIKEGATEISPSLKKTAGYFGNIGVNAEKAGAMSAKMYKDGSDKAKAFLDASEMAKSYMARRLGMSVADLTKAAKAAIVAGREPEGMAAVAIAKAAMPSSGVAKPVRREIDEEMGRESKESKNLKKLTQQFEQMTLTMGKIVEYLDESDDPQKILELLKRYLPKMTERPSQLGPDSSRW